MEETAMEVNMKSGSSILELCQKAYSTGISDGYAGKRDNIGSLMYWEREAYMQGWNTGQNIYACNRR